MTAGWGWEKGGLEAGVGLVVGQQPGKKGTVPLLSCPHQLTELTTWDLGACGDQRNSWVWLLGTALQLGWWCGVLAQDILALDSREC